MSDEPTGQTPDSVLFNEFKLDVTFRFAEQWHIGRVGQADQAAISHVEPPGTRSGFPPGTGGGLTAQPIGQADQAATSDVDTPGTRSGFPAGTGGGLTPQPKRGILIGPITLKGLPSDEVAKIVRHRAEDMAMLAEAITIANIQFREALDSIAAPDRATEDDPA